MGLFKKFRRKELQDVFTPNTVAKLAYVRRDKIEADLLSNITIPGKQIILYGHSGSGKTTLIRKMLCDKKINFVQTHCTVDTTINDIILDTFDNLDRFYIAEKKSNCSYSITSSFKLEYSSIASEMSAQQASSSGETMIRLLPPRLTIQKLAKFLGEINAVWIIEDFHKVPNEEKKKIADILKIFIDVANDYPKVKIICIGAVGSARELMSLDSNLYPRIAELHVPLLSDKEIKAIINQGCKFLNISMSGNLIEKISYYSNRLASLTHQMCYDICDSNKILKCQYRHRKIDDKYFKSAIESYLKRNADTLKGIYDLSVKRKIAWYILKTFVSIGKDFVSFSEIQDRVCQNQRQYTNEEIMKELDQLSSVAVNIIRYDNNSDRYSISTPFWGAFLKMQIAIDGANKRNNAKDRSKRNKMLILKNQDDIDADVYNVLLEKMEQLRMMRLRISSDNKNNL